MKIQYPLFGENPPCICFDGVDFDGYIYQIYASFDKVLRVFDLLSDVGVSDIIRRDTALKILLVDYGEVSSLADRSGLLNAMIDHFNFSGEQQQEENVDIKGNPLPAKKQVETYSINHDGGLIYAAFLQSYGIDLIDQQGKLHWTKFVALLSGLPKDTKFIEICGYRSYEKPSKKDTLEKQMLKLKELYALPGGGGDNG